jgi:hypothetical protein
MEEEKHEPSVCFLGIKKRKRGVTTNNSQESQYINKSATLFSEGRRLIRIEPTRGGMDVIIVA